MAEDRPFVDLGLDSILGVELIKELNRTFGLEMKASRLFDHPTAASLAAHVAGLVPSGGEERQGAEAVSSLPPGAPPAGVKVGIPVPSEEAVARLLERAEAPPAGLLFEGEAVGDERRVQRLVVGSRENVCLGDHVVAGRYVMPTDAYLEMLAVAARRELGEGPVHVERLRLAAPLALDEGERRDVVVRLDDFAGGLRFTVESAGPEGTELNAEGLFGRSEAGELLTARHWRVLDGCETRIPGAEVYSGEGGSRFGELYRTIREIRVLGEAAVSVLEPTSAALEKRDRFLVCPALLDGLLVTALTFARVRAGDRTRLFLPVLMEEVLLPASLPAGRAFGLVEVLEEAPDWVTFRASLVDEENEVVFSCGRLHVSEVQPAALAASPPAVRPSPAPSRGRPEAEPVAVVGMSCRFPGAGSVKEFWKNVVAGTDSVTRVPLERWDADLFYDADPRTPNRSYSREGGFLSDVDRFDPLFFNLSPEEAELMDPQQRLFLEEAWKALEDAGYSDRGLSGVRCGVFVGASTGDYMHLLGPENANSAQAFTGLAPSILAARISYFLNLTGPSVAIDTACSSSLLAVRQAVESLRSGDSDLALAGGVALMLSPDLHIKSCKTGILSPTGRCRSFDRSADGIVLGEGVGVVVLKSLSLALADRDHVYAVIRAAGANQDGRTNGITAPSGAAQARLLRDVYARSGFDPSSVGLIEAHGTGTPLGDPVEVEALMEVFREAGAKEASCAVGSVKANIGHTTLAAGIASFLKVVLAVRHGVIPPQANFSAPAEGYGFDGSPLYVPRTAGPFRTPGPRRAGVSSFGFSGTNVHVVVEEPPARDETSRSGPSRPVELIAISAKSPEALSARIADLVAWLDAPGEERGSASLADVAFTLLQGRSHFKVRAAFVAGSFDELRAQLREAVGGGRPAGSATRDLRRNKAAAPEFLVERGQETLRLLAASPGTGGAPWPQDELRERLAGLAELFAAGAAVDWSLLYPEGSRDRVSLPPYPFSRGRYWVEASVARPHAAPSGPLPVRSRLVRIVSSSPDGHRLSARLEGDEFFLADHGIGEKRTLPGAALLEIARAAGATACGREVRSLRDVVWTSPVTLAPGAGPVDLDLLVRPLPDDGASFEIRREIEGVADLCCKGRLSFVRRGGDEPETVSRESLEALAERGTEMAGEEFYSRFDARGLHLGPSFRVIRTLRLSDGEALSHLGLPPERSGDGDDLVLHPSLIDGAFQTGVATLRGAGEELLVPFSLGEVELLRPLVPACRVRATRGEGAGAAARIELLDGEGNVLVRMRDFLARPLTGAGQAARTILGHAAWEAAPRTGPAGPLAGALLVMARDGSLLPHLARGGAPERIALVTPGASFGRTGERTWEIDPRRPEDHRRLLGELGEAGLSPVAVLHCWGEESGEPAAFAPDGVPLALASLLLLLQALQGDAPKARRRLLHAYERGPSGSVPASSALGGFARSVALETPGTVLTTLAWEGGLPERAAAALAELGDDAAPGLEVELRRGERRVRRLLEVHSARGPAEGSPLVPGGVYLVTGGAGRLGLSLCRWLARQTRGRIVLCGRSPISPGIEGSVAGLTALGAEALYLRADVSSRPDVTALVSEAVARFGDLSGVFHLAGATRDGLLGRKSLADVSAVLAAKVRGTLLLDEATSGHPLASFALFSSMAGALGNRGQSDYAYANAFLDAFAGWREERRAEGSRNGRTVAVGWPLLAEGSLRGDRASERLAEAAVGLVPLPVERAWPVLLDALAGRLPSPLLVLHGDPARTLRLFADPAGRVGPAVRSAGAPPLPAGPALAAVGTSPDPGTASGEAGFGARAADELVGLACALLKLEPSDVVPEEEMSEYGFNSINLTEFAARVNDRYGIDLTPAVLFEHSTLEALSRHLAAAYPDALRRHFAGSPTLSATGVATSGERPPAAAHDRALAPDPPLATRFREAAVPLREGGVAGDPEDPDSRAVAIVGVSGVMPGSEDLASFWRNLEEERDLVTEIPPDRWDWRAYAGEAANGANRTNVRWGGFMPGVDLFDPLFFGISPREAELMDPQQRLLLQAVWRAVEDAGERPSSLAGTRTGVFLGVSTSDYGELLRERSTGIGTHGSTGMAHSVLANRISYFLDVHGPSEPIDTACSSSLVALHRAVQAIRSGACETALAGGVNALLSPTLFIAFAQAGMLSQDGRCRSFDRSANGYVRGEGVGVLFLKPLRAARRDGNPIYAVIRGSALNHGGRASSLTAPNPKAQAQLLVEAFEDARVDPFTLGYVEAHGTGTPLGDPIEVNALRQAFATWRERHGGEPPAGARCGIGTVKSNIGHLEAAAGVAGVLKVLLAMQHRRLPATLHVRELNPQIRLEGTPFEVVSRTRDWTPLGDGEGRPLPLRAGVSSFGFGGVNVHVVLEAFEPPRRPETGAETEQVIVLSARTPERLAEAASRMASRLEEAGERPPRLADVAFTLQEGREAMEERMAFVVRSVPDAVRLLREAATSPVGGPDLFRGRVSGRRRQTLFDGEEGREFLRIAVEGRKLGKLAQLWATGVPVDWSLTRGPERRERISLPGYPFARERYWVPEGTPRQTGTDTAGISPDPRPARTPEAGLPGGDEGAGRGTSARLHGRRWVPQVAPGSAGAEELFPLLLLDTGEELRGAILEQLPASPAIVLVKPGRAFLEAGPLTFEVDPREPLDLVRLRHALAGRGIRPVALVHAWSAPPGDLAVYLGEGVERTLLPLFHLAGAFDESIRRWVVVGAPLDPFVEAAGGIARSLPGRPAFTSLRSTETAASLLASRILSELGSGAPGTVREVRYEGGLREVRQTVALELEGGGRAAFRRGAVYLVTGGLGALGRLVSRHLAGLGARLALVGRSPEGSGSESALAEIASLGGEAVYVVANVSDAAQVRRAVDAIHERMGPIAGVLHAAGRLPTGLARGDGVELTATLAPKVAGTVHLDVATAGDPLDFFLSFSSISSLVGDLGTGAYAVANRFLDGFTFWRKAEQERGRRPGRSLVVDWPLWREGGAARLARAGGAEPAGGLLETADALAVLDLVVGGGATQTIVFAREEGLSGEGPPDARREVAAGGGEDLALRAERHLAALLATELRLAPGGIDVDTPLSSYGLDSILLNQVTGILSKGVGPLPKTLFLEHETVREAAAYLAGHHAEGLATLLGDGADAVSEVPARTAPAAAERVETAAPVGHRGRRERGRGEEPIAVIGLAGRYPGSPELARFWENLRSGRSSITEVPRTRWDAEELFDPDPARADEGKIYCRWGAFLEDVESFDALHFGISPAEARSLKPEERLLLELATEALDDAGHHRASLSGQRTAVFVGVTANTFPLAALDRFRSQPELPLDTSVFSLANRISHHFDLRGPSLAVDTGCSSSLVAVHLALESLRTGAADVALAGGVNLVLHPSKYRLMCQGRLLASRGASQLFARDGDGFLPGEGGGVVVLKPLSRAVADGDNVQGVLLGSAVSHKGSRAGYRMPSPSAQAELLEELFESADVPPSTVGYVEAQAIGSELADAAEWSALRRLFGPRPHGDEGGARSVPCLVGSLKPNIGHLEAASGLAQLTKVLLMMRHGWIAPSQVAPELNPGVELEGSALSLARTGAPWPGGGAPRRALVSSSGVGGVQATLLVEAFEGARKPAATPRPEVVAVSAKTERSLRRRLEELSAAAVRLCGEVGPDAPVTDVAHTLQVGREELRERFATVCSTLGELRDLLAAHLHGEGAEVHRGRAATGAGPAEVPAGTADRAGLAALADAWVNGARADWLAAAGGRPARRVSLPPTPFERERCWPDAGEATPAPPVPAYYGKMANAVRERVGDEEVHLVFAPFLEPVPGFSWLLTFFEPEGRGEHRDLMLRAQRELKSVLLAGVDFEKATRVLDIGCGFSTDLIGLAREHPKVTGVGYTITPEQAQIGKARIQKAGLEGRLQVFHRDSTKDPFPGLFDVALAFEVLFHIEDKAGAIANVARHLAPGGTFLVADCVANTVTDIILPRLGQFTPTASRLAGLLASSGLRVDACVDVGLEMSRFLDDPDFERHLATLHARIPGSEAGEAEHRGFHNCGKAFAQGLIRYVLLTVTKGDPAVPAADLAAANAGCLARPVPYREALERMPALAAPAPVPASAPLPGPAHIAPEEGGGARAARSVEEAILAVAARVLGVAVDRIDPEARFVELGIDSLVGLRLLDAVNRELGLELPMETLYDRSSVRDLAAFAERSLPAGWSVARGPAVRTEPSAPASAPVAYPPIAVVGMAGRFPGAPNVDAFWRNLRDGVDSVTEVPSDRWDVAEFYDPDPARPGRSTAKWGGFLPDVDAFDAPFFRITRPEAELMDPQQRLFLETSWAALEDAGLPPSALGGKRCGVFAGVISNDYQMLLARAGTSHHLGNAMLGNADSILAARISYALDLKGPALGIDTACSSSLVAIHLACRSLQSGEVDLALAGGVTLYLDPAGFVMMSKAGMLSPTGRCRAFDEKADGIVTGEAVGAVVLKRLDEALADGDQIHGVIRGSGVNQDGRTNGITAPSKESQKALEVEVYRRAGIDPRTIGLVEAHGTGTRLGDPIEVAALTEAFREFTGEERFVALGSVKSNIGHASAASGVAGLIKALQALRHRQIPPTLHVASPSPFLDLPRSPFFLATALAPWAAPAGVARRAAVSAFGFSGTNAHVVVEEAPEPSARAVSAGPHRIALSARDARGLTERARDLVAFLRREGDGPLPALADIAFTLQHGRDAMGERLAFEASSHGELAERLSRFLAGDVAAPGLTRSSGGGPDEIPSPAATVAGRRVSLPTYPFARERYWFRTGKGEPPDAGKPGGREPRLFEGTRTGGPGDARTVTYDLAPETNVLLREHTVFGLPCLSTDGILEMVHQEVRDRLGTGRVRLGEVFLFSPLTGAPGSVTRAELSLAGGGATGRFVLRSGDVSTAGAPRKVAEGGFSPLARGERAERVPLPETAAEELDARLLERPDHPLQAGEFFRSLSRLSLWTRRAVGELRLSAAARAVPERFSLHPGLLDGVLGVALALAAHHSGDDLAAFVPLSISEVSTFAELGEGDYTADVRLVHESPDVLRFDADLVDGSGQVAVALRGLDERRVSAADLARASAVGDAPSAAQADLAPTAVGGAPKLRLRPLQPPAVGAGSGAGAGGGAQTKAFLRRLLGETLLVDPSTLGDGESLVEQGVDSILGLEFVQNLNRSTGLRLPGTVLFENPTIDRLTRFLSENHPGLVGAPAHGDPGVGTDLNEREVGAALPPAPAAGGLPGDQSLSLIQSVERTLLGKLAETLMVGEGTLDSRRSLVEQGIDSILGLEFVQCVGRHYGAHLPGTLLFEHPTVERLARHLAATEPAILSFHGGAAPSGGTALPEAATAPAPPGRSEAKEARLVPPAAPVVRRPAEIAVIGMAGRFPGSRTLDEMWRNLAERRYLVKAVPEDHWDSRPFFRPGSPSNRIYTDRGGFLDDVDRFDPLFFHVSPREADAMDPQLRLFLEVLWECLEDAGHAGRVKGSRTGLYLGNCYNDYLDLLKQGDGIDFQFAGSGNSSSMLSNRAAYYFDLRGPCLTLDTACSSSLVALHLACQALRNGECTMAVAGGVNLNLSPSKYLSFCAMGAFSKSGDIRPFDAAADGYLPGEGIAAVLLKPLDEAIRDGDRIQGVVRGSSVRCAGRSAGPTVPNPEEETATLVDAWQNAGIDPETLTFLEAHGTGTVLGDPLEWNAIRRAFETFTGKRGFCAVGTVKGNFGHTEATAGLAGVLRVLLQMKHRTIAGSPNLKVPNPMISLEGSPVVLAERTGPWEAPPGAPLRAGVSSFGMGGTYAHVVLEEPPSVPRPPSPPPGPERVVLSARTPERLREVVSRLSRFLAELPEGERGPALLGDIAYTLRVGREAMEERLSFVAGSVDDLERILGDYLRDPESIPADPGEALEGPATRGRLLALPTYPFERERCWLRAKPPRTGGESGKTGPLLEGLDYRASANEAGALVFRGTLRASDPLLDGHRVLGEALLPGAVFVQLALEALGEAAPEERFTLSRVVWGRPLAVPGGEVAVRVALRGTGEGFAVELRSVREGGPTVHASCGAWPARGTAVPVPVAIGAIRERCVRSIEGEALYQEFESAGLSYGPMFRGLRRLFSGKREALGRLEMPGGADQPFSRFAIHPALLDAALQGVSVLLGPPGGVARLRLPYAVESVDVWRRPGPTGWVHVEAVGAARFHVTLLADDGSVCATLRDLSVRELQAAEPISPAPTAPADRTAARPGPDFLFVPRWVERSVPGEALAPGRGRALVVAPAGGEARALALALCARLGRERTVVVGAGEELEASFRTSPGELTDVTFLAGFDAEEFPADLPALEASQDRTLWPFFRLVKALLAHGYANRPLVLRAVTNGVHAADPEERSRPLSAGVLGLCRTVASECRSWRVTGVDVRGGGVGTWDGLAAALLSEPPLAPGEDVTLRPSGRRVRLYEPFAPGAKQGASLLRPGGVYLVAGGAGGLGLTVCRHLASRWKARLVLVGRREPDAEILSAITSLERAGGKALYVPADLASPGGLRGAVKAGRERFGPIQGAVHSALVLRDTRLAAMDGNGLREVLAPKVSGSMGLHLALEGEPLDFLLFFSSVQSLMGNPGQGNYAAASTFEDAWAHALGQRLSLPVKLIRWGFWGSVGAVATEAYRRQMASLGVHSIQPEEGMGVVDVALSAGSPDSLVAVKGEPRFLRSIGLPSPSRMERYPERIPSVLSSTLSRLATEELPDGE